MRRPNRVAEVGILDSLNPIKLVSDGVNALAKTVFGGIDELSTSEEEKLTLRNQIEEAFQQFQLAVTSMALELEKERASVIKTEIAEGGWLGRSWRPILMLTFGAVIVYTVVAPAFGLPTVDMSGVPDRMWSLMTVGIGGYVAGRTIEKVIPNTKWGSNNAVE